ncbi:LapA family protein [bacterium]|nr:LapA family protein [bacterium]
MWIARWTLITILILVILGLALQNDDLVEISLFNWHSGQLPVYFIFYFAFAAGMLVFLLISGYFQFVRYMELNRCRKEIARLELEVDKLKRQDPGQISQTNNEKMEVE